MGSTARHEPTPRQEALRATPRQEALRAYATREAASRVVESEAVKAAAAMRNLDDAKQQA